MQRPDFLDRITPFQVMEVMEAAFRMEAKGLDIVHLEVGEPDTEPPDVVKEALTEALWKKPTGYSPSLGLPELREAISRRYFERYTVDINPERIIITSGTSPALLLALAVSSPRRSKVLLSNPYYACYPNFLHFLDINPCFFPLNHQEGFRYNPEIIRKAVHDDVSAILINSPSNPTGMLIEPKALKEIASMGPTIISDEIYHGLVYEESEHSILEYNNDALVINGFSKLYAMTGWRLGYLIAPKECVRDIQKLQQSLFISANTFVQRAGVAALEKGGDFVEKALSKYDAGRKKMLEELPKMGFKIYAEPKGAFYILADARLFGNDSLLLAKDILEKARVGVTPGIDFGSRTEGFLRFSYANSPENIDKGLERLAEYLADRS